MSAQPAEQSIQTPRRASHGADGTPNVDAQQHDVWAELFGIVHGLAETVGLALQAFTPSDDKAVSAITKKRLSLRSIHGLKQSQDGIETLLEHLKALQAASQTWQRSMLYASKSHQELMEQIESTTEELHKTNERLRAVEAQRLAAVREAELLRARVEQQEIVIKEARSSLKHKDDELETLQFSLHELQSSSSVAQQNLERARQATSEADERVRTATSALDDAKGEAAKAQNLAERHQQVVAKLTADNLVFLMQLKKVEADLAVANQERAQLRLAAEQQRGPWFDQVRAGVEERVRQAMQRAQELEAHMERREAEHGTQVQGMQAQQDRLEEQLSAVRQDAHELQKRLEAALESRDRAESLRSSAEAAAQEARRELDNLAAENRVLQESIRSIRQECTERWVSEQAALGRIEGLELRIEELQQLAAHQAVQLASLQRQLDTQAGINRQLMARKEEVEWQLMAAMTKIDGGAADQPGPLNLQVSGLLHVGGPNQHQRIRTVSAGTAASSPGRTAAAEPAGVASVSASHNSFRSGAAGGAESRRATPSNGFRADRGESPRAYSPQPRSLPAYVAAVFPLDGSEHVNALASRANSPYASGLMQRAGVTAGSLSVFGGSPPQVVRLGVGASPQGQMDSLLVKEPTLLITQGDLTTITHTPVGGAAAASSTSIVDPRLPLLPPQLMTQMPRGAPGPSDEGDGAAGAGGGGGASAGRGLDPPARWTSQEGGSTVVSSPPSSVALSAEPGSSSGAPSHVTSELNNREPAPRVAAVTIRTVSTGQWRPGGVACGGQLAVSADASAGPDWAQVKGRGPACPAAAAADGTMATLVPAAGTCQLERRGSLHDGDDVWLPHVVSSSSSGDSDFLFASGIVVQHETHIEEPRNVQTPAQQAQLYQLQQRLQMQLQGPAGGAQWERPCQGPEPAPRSSCSYNRGDDNDDDVIRVRAPVRGIDGSAVVIRPAIGIRTAPADASAGAGPVALSAKTSSALVAGFRAGDDPGVGVFSIVKGGAQQEAAARLAGSPMHPAMSGGLGRAASLQAVSAACPKPSPPSGLASNMAPATVSRVTHEENAAAAIVPPKDAPRESGAPASTNPIPSRIQAGPPFFATGAPLDSSAVEALHRWTLSIGGQEATPLTSAQPHYRQRPEALMPLSPALSTASMRSPRSPPHPAIVWVAERGRDPSCAAGGLRARTDSVSVSGESSIGLEGSPRPMEAESGPRHAAGGAVEAPTAVSAAVQAARLQVQAVSTSQEGASEPAADAAAGVPARARVSFHELTYGQSTGASQGDGNTGTVVVHTREGSMPSSNGSFSQGGGNGNGALQLPKTSSVKSVRFSDHDPEDGGAQTVLRRREGHEQSGTGFAGRMSLKMPASRLDQDAAGRYFSQRTSIDSYVSGDRLSAEQQCQARASNVTESSLVYRSMGPVSHPAMLGVPAAATTALTTGALDTAEILSSKRHSAAGVATTTIPRAQA